MNNTLKFYGIREGNFIVALPGQNLDNIKIAWLLEESTNYFEVFINVDETNIESVKPLDIDKVLPEALKAAKDHNQYVLSELNQTEKEDNYFVDKELLQDIIDRILHFGGPFKKDLDALLKKFPLATEWVRTKEGSVRKTWADLGVSEATAEYGVNTPLTWESDNVNARFLKPE